MRAVITAFRAGLEAIWHKAELARARENVLRAALASGLFEAVHVVSDDREVVATARAMEGQGVLMAAPADMARAPWPCGFPRAARAVLAATGWSGDIMGLDATCPFLEAELQRAAARRYAATDAPMLAATVVPQDHPCQFFKYFSLRCSGQLAWIDPGAPRVAGCRVTRAFPFAWDRFGLDAAPPGTCLRLRAGRFGIGFEPARSGDTAPRFVVAAPRQARALVPPRLEERDVVAYDPCRPGDGLTAVRERSVPGLLRVREASGRPAGPYLYLVVPGDRGELRGLFLEATADGGFLLDEAVLGRETAAVAYYALAPWENDRRHTPLCFTYEGDGLWRKDMDGWTVNLVTGRHINGRQDFPEVHTFAGALCVVHADLLSRLDGTAPQDWPAMAGLQLTEFQATRIDGLVALLRFKAVMAALRETSGTGACACRREAPEQ